MDALGDPEERVVDVALQVISIYKVPVDEARIVELLDREETGIRVGVLWTLAALEAREYAPRIAEELRSGEVEVRWTAARALGTLGSKETIPVLEAALAKESHAAVQQDIRDAIRRLQRSSKP